MNKKMKYSGVDWIGEIPEDWEVIRLKDKYINKKEIVGTKFNEFDRLALTLNGVIKRDKFDNEGLQPKEFNGYQIINKNDLIFKMIDLQNISTSRIGLSKYTGLVSPAYIRFSPKNSLQCNEFIYYFLMSMYYNCVYNNLGNNGVRSSLNYQDIGELLCPFPKDDIQNLIVEILDKKCSQIDNLITNQQQQIEKLKQYKQSLITEVVTKGLDSNVPMKDSGVEWIGEIPEHWEIRKIKYISTIEKECWSNEYKDIKYIGLENIESGSGKKIETNSIYEKEKAIIYKEKDILFGKLRPYLAKVYLSNEIGCCSSEFCIIRIKNNYFEGYLWGILISKSFIDTVNFSTYGTKMPRVNTSFIKNMFIPIPKLNEQKEIYFYMNSKCSQIDNLIK